MPIPPVDRCPPSSPFVCITPKMRLMEPDTQEEWRGYAIALLRSRKDPCDLWLSPGDAGPHGEVGEEEKKTCEQMFDHFSSDHRWGNGFTEEDSFFESFLFHRSEFHRSYQNSR